MRLIKWALLGTGLYMLHSLTKSNEQLQRQIDELKREQDNLKSDRWASSSPSVN